MMYTNSIQNLELDDNICRQNQTARSVAESKGDSSAQVQGPKRMVRFQTPRASPFQSPHMSPFSTPRSHPGSEVNSLHRAALRLKKTNLEGKTPSSPGAQTPPERSATPIHDIAAAAAAAAAGHQRVVRLRKTDSDERKSPSGAQTPPERSGTPVTDNIEHQRVVHLRKTDSDDIKPPSGGTQTPPERSGTPVTENATGRNHTVRLKKTDLDEAKAQQTKHQQAPSGAQHLPPPAQPHQRPKKTKVSALIESDGSRPNSGPDRRPGSSTTTVVKSKATSNSPKTYVTRRRGSENSSSLTRQFSPS